MYLNFHCFQLSLVPCVRFHYLPHCCRLLLYLHIDQSHTVPLLPLPLIFFASSSFASSFSYLFFSVFLYFLTLILKNIVFLVLPIANTQIWQIKECVLTIMLCIVIVYILPRKFIL